MAVVYTKKDQGITYTVGSGSPSHSGSTGDRYIDTSSGVNYSYTTSWQAFSAEALQFAVSDETTSITTGTSKVTIRAPYAMTITSVRASLTTAQTSGNTFTADIKVGGSSILSTLITIDNTEKTTTTAATLPVVSSTSLADDAEIKVDVTQIGSGDATGLKITILGYRV